MREDAKTPRGRREKHKGPTILRGAQVDLSTTDQRLLDSRGMLATSTFHGVPVTEYRSVCKPAGARSTR